MNSDLDLFTEPDLMQAADEAFQNTMRMFDEIEARKLYGPDAVAMRTAAYEQAELHHALCVELGRRTAERAASGE